MFSLKVILNLAIAANCVWLIAGGPLEQVPEDPNGAGSITGLESRSASIETRAEGVELPIFDIRFDTLPSHCSSAVPKNCAEATACTNRSGYYRIKLNAFSNDAFLVECDATTEGGDWTVIQRRLDGSENFFRPWSQYKLGFGAIEGEHFIGLDRLYALTNLDSRQELLVSLEMNDRTASYAKYSSFAIGNETDGYVLKRVGRYIGNAGDSLQAHVGSKFSTLDRDNGNTKPNAATTFSSAWWYNANRVSDLNGLFGKTDEKGIFWNTYYAKGRYIKTVTMMIRRSRG